MSVGEYKDLVTDLNLPELLTEAENVSEAMATPGWKLVQASIDFRVQRLVQRLVQPGTKAEDIGYLRGQIAALAAMREAAEGITSLAKEREREAIKSAQAQESYV